MLGAGHQFIRDLLPEALVFLVQLLIALANNLVAHQKLVVLPAGHVAIKGSVQKQSVIDH